MSTTVKCESSVTTDRDEYLHAEDVAAWAAQLPPNAKIHHTTKAVGHQLDPHHILVGLRATWTEER